MLERRAFLIGLAAALAPVGVQAQKLRRIGWISTEAQPDPFVDGFDLDALRAAVTELTQSEVAFIVSSGPAIRAIRGARDAPVLFAISGDPVHLPLPRDRGKAGRASEAGGAGATSCCAARTSRSCRSSSPPSSSWWST